MAVNQVSNKQEVIPPAQAISSNAPMAKALSSPVLRRIFQFGATSPSCPSAPASPTSPTLSQVRMVLFHDVESAWTHASNGAGNHEWVILDSGFAVSLLTARYQADADTIVALGTLRNCQVLCKQLRSGRQN